MVNSHLDTHTRWLSVTSQNKLMTVLLNLTSSEKGDGRWQDLREKYRKLYFPWSPKKHQTTSGFHTNSVDPTNVTAILQYCGFHTPRCTLISVMSDSAIPCTAARQAPLSLGILWPRMLEWVVMPSSRIFPTQRVKPRSPALQEDSLPTE